MRVTADHHIDVRGNRVEVKIVDRMDEVEEVALQLDGLCRRKQRGGALTIDIASNGRHRSDLPETIEDRSRAHIPCVEDVIRPGKRGECLESKEAVGI